MNQTTKYSQPETAQAPEIEIHYKTAVRPAQRPEIQNAPDVYNIMTENGEMSRNMEYKEMFFALYLNQANKLLALHKIGEGTTTAAPALTLVKSVIVPSIGGTPAEAKPATPAKTETKPAAPAKAETKPAAETKQEKPTEATKEAPKTETPKEATPAPATAAPAAETEQKPAEPTPAPAPAPMSAEEAAAAAIRAAEEADRKRRESLAEMQKRLDEELERLNHKREIAEKREMFIKCREDIENYIEELEDEEEFETSICRLSFERFTKDGLNREEFKKVMTVSNTAIVKKFCEAMSAEICAKVGEIETELLTA